MDENKISVIVLVYNIEQYLSKCLDSIINQTYRNLEIIIIDDGSTDSSKDICDIYKKKDQRIKVIHQKIVDQVWQEKWVLEMHQDSILDLLMVMIILIRTCI